METTRKSQSKDHKSERHPSRLRRTPPYEQAGELFALPEPLYNAVGLVHAKFACFA